MLKLFIFIILGLLLVGLNLTSAHQARADVVTGSKLLEIEEKATVSAGERAISALACLHGIFEVGYFYYNSENFNPFREPLETTIVGTIGGGLDPISVVADCSAIGAPHEWRAALEPLACLTALPVMINNGRELGFGHAEDGHYGEKIVKGASVPITLVSCWTAFFKK
jgi:hypothetical protein